MSAKKNLYCAVSDCNQKNENLEKRHFFKFPKEHDRWLQWVRACGRLDLEPKGPEYFSQNCRLCHLHFEEKWYNVNKIRARLHPDAIPTRFSGPTFDKNNAAVSNMEEDNAGKTQIASTEIHAAVEVENKMEQQKKHKDEEQIIEADTQQGKRNGSTSSNPVTMSIQSTENSPRKRKLRMKIIKLKAQNKTLRETVRRLRMEKKKQTRNAPINKEAEHETLRKLGYLHVPHSEFE
ncbi:52 kDa repressor of the inhibitor of the protein kinase [Formica fusca]